ncbi:MAG: hypothetical protein FWF79_00270, partial [Defluviitaleaceae bacterium]|nr:hypothetical protein [Defluviitaleaceae bacterium]
VMGLIFGLLDALPHLITAAIDLVISLVKGIGTMLPMLIEAGIELIISLVEGLLMKTADAPQSKPLMMKSRHYVPPIGKRCRCSMKNLH